MMLDSEPPWTMVHLFTEETFGKTLHTGQLSLIEIQNSACPNHIALHSLSAALAGNSDYWNSEPNCPPKGAAQFNSLLNAPE